MRIPEYPLSKTIGDNDMLVVETDEGTRKMKAKTLAEQVSDGSVSDTISDIVGSSDFSKIIDKIYPVGSLYMSYTNTSPASRFGGSWVQVIDKFLRAANDTNPGGSDTVALTTAQMPSHRHSAQGGFYLWKWGNSLSSEKDLVRPVVEGVGYGVVATPYSGAYSHNWIYTHEKPTDSARDRGATWVTNVGSGSNINIMPSYQDVYVWRRIA